MKYATDEAMRTGMTLQKSYIDNGDSTNARALDDAKRELKASIDQNSHDIESVSKKVDLITGPIHYYVAKYAKGSNDNTEISHLGNKDILKNFGFVLLDTSDNKNITTKPKRLKDNNLFRFEDGTFAPTVGITTEQYNQCMANDIYSMDMDESSNPVYTLVYRAGQFNAAVQWEKDKALIKAGHHAQRLYTMVPGSVGDTSSTYKLVTHVLRPWETTETKYTIGIANLVDMYLLDNQVGDSGAYWKGIFLEPVSWDGIDVTKHKLPPTAIGPCPVTTIEENGLTKTRNFFYLYKGMNNCQSNGGLLPNHDFVENRTYPRVNDMNQVNNMVYARNNNYDVTKPYPFAEGGYHATNTFITALELLAGTRYLHQANMFGSGISSNDGCNEGNFFTSGGVRFHAPGDDWTYKTFGYDSSPLQYHSNGSTSRMSQVLYNDYPIEQCMESQMAASMATELGINPTTDPTSPNWFDFYGNDYYYMNVPGFDGLQEGRMNTRVYKQVNKSEVSAYKKKAATNFEVDVILRMSLFNGANLSGDTSVYNGGGLEIVGSCTVDPDNFDPKVDEFGTQFVGNKIDIYVEPDQTKWHSETVISKNGLDQVFGFEALYRHVLETTNLGDSYTLTREGLTPWKTANAYSMVQGECYHQLDYNDWGSLNQRVRTGLLFRSISCDSGCSHRAIETREAASYTYKYISGSAQALIEL